MHEGQQGDAAEECTGGVHAASGAADATTMVDVLRAEEQLLDAAGQALEGTAAPRSPDAQSTGETRTCAPTRAGTCASRCTPASHAPRRLADRYEGARESHRARDTQVGVCFGCSMNCHLNCRLEECYSKHDFRCDCGTPSSSFHRTAANRVAAECTCLLAQHGVAKEDNAANRYGHNFEGYSTFYFTPPFRSAVCVALVGHRAAGTASVTSRTATTRTR